MTVVPYCLKTTAGVNSKGVPIILSGSAVMDPAIWLHRAVTTAAVAEQPISDFVVRSSSGHYKSFSSEPISTAGMHE